MSDRTLYLDCFAGVAGDMLLGALIDLGLDFDAWRDELAGLALDGYTVERETVMRGGIVCCKIDVVTEPAHHHRRLADIEAILDRAALPARVVARARAVFQRLAEAEGRVHGVTPEEVTFHEVGAIDAIVDITGVMLAVERLDVARVVASPITLGRHVVDTAHGPIPTPAPATLQLLGDVPVAPTDIAAELTTPTGAALVTTLADSYGPAPAGRVGAIGYGAGTRDLAERPNAVRAVRIDGAAVAAQKWVLECNVDDMSPEHVASVFPVLLTEGGALDVWATSVVMKKGRPGLRLSAMVDADRVDAVTDLLLWHTSTFGVRRYPVDRVELDRDWVLVETPWGKVRIKVGSRGGAEWQASPEYDDCARVAEAHRVPVGRVFAAALAVWERTREPGESP